MHIERLADDMSVDAGPTTGDPTSQREATDRFLSSLVQAGIPNIALNYLKDGDDETVFSGSLAVDDLRPVGFRTLFGFACMGKILVASAVYSLANDRIIDLNAPITTYLRRELTPKSSNRRPVTMKHLLTHTSGYRGLGEERWRLSSEDALRYFFDCDQLFEPGTAFNEEGLDFALLGEIVRRVSGENVFQHVQERILAPLKVAANTVRCDPCLELAGGHKYSVELGTMVRADDNLASDFWAPAACNLMMSIGDLIKINRALRSNESEFGLPLRADKIMVEKFRLPTAVCKGRHLGWLPATFGGGLSEFRNGYVGAYSTGRGQSLALVFDPRSGNSFTVAMSCVSARLRSRLLHFLDVSASDDLQDTPLRNGPSRDPEVTYTDFVSGFDAAMLSGRYRGPGGQEVTIQAVEDALCVFAAPINFMARRLQRDRLSVQADSPISVSIFRSSDGTPALMLGLSSYRKTE